MSSDKETRIALLLMEASRSGVRDPNLRDVVTDYFTHESETVSLVLTLTLTDAGGGRGVSRAVIELSIASY